MNDWKEGFTCGLGDYSFGAFGGNNFGRFNSRLDVWAVKEAAMFDPDKVDKLPPYIFNEYNQTLQAVSASEYDQLLQLYRALLESHGPEGSLGYIAAKAGQLAPEASLNQWPHHGYDKP